MLLVLSVSILSTPYMCNRQLLFRYRSMDSLFVVFLISHFGFESRFLALIVQVPDHNLSFKFLKIKLALGTLFSNRFGAERVYYVNISVLKNLYLKIR